MSGNEWFLIAVFVGIFLAENVFSFQKERPSPVKHFFRNLSFAAMSAGVAFLFASSLIGATRWARSQEWGILNQLNAPLVLRVILAIVLFDIWMYFWHRINHEVPFFWRFHRMHHTDPALDTTTAFRFHPFEILFSNILNIGVLFLLGLYFTELVIYRAFLYPVILFHHSNIDLPESVDKHLRKVIVTPHMHKVHHSQIRNETNSNYGSIFPYWDRLFRSFRLRESLQGLVYGIGVFKGERSQSVWGMLKVPFREFKKPVRK
jgi:sterol desaturase/sphingolipid hydroxylase (fatty acid hydroxylase superfamily)